MASYHSHRIDFDESRDQDAIDMGWTFKWQLVPVGSAPGRIEPSYRDNVPLAVHMLPATGSHNLIHVEGDMAMKTEIGIDLKVTAYGVSAEVEY
ncbi:hypothetical protein QFC24_000767 [Naganishia onofrii]|uniref:Uncharacterized protein n=1 Tax=Naganishia onofrii TaxID=1851511 RepID=A0ACC2XTJ7_9TREE|nr:hypothetical protein QFC24_000767 [Naganishia onofrii]